MNNLDLEVVEFIKCGADFGFVLTGLGEDRYLSADEVVTLLTENEMVEIDFLFEDFLYIKVNGIDASIESC